MERFGQSQKKVVTAIVASILFHVLLLIFFGFWMDLRANQPSIKPAFQDKPLEITIVPQSTPPQIAVAPTPPPERIVIDSDQFTPSDTPTPESAFDSAQDTIAGGDKPGVGPKNMPNVTGIRSNEINLQNQQSSLGDKAAEPPKQPAKAPDKKPTPQPPKPADIAEATPTPPPDLADFLDLGRPLPTPKPTSAPIAEKRPDTRGQAYRPETRASGIQGSLSNRGRPSIATRGTPLGRYLSQVERAIGSRWYFYIKRDAAFVAPGAVRIIFKIDKNGKVSDLQVLSNTSNESFASTSTQSIMDAEFPPIPDEVASTLYTQRLELPFTFTIY